MKTLKQGYVRMLPARFFKTTIVVALVVLQACVSNPRDTYITTSGEAIPPVIAQHNPDKYEGFNRAIFRFNETMDNWLLKPVARGYDTVLPWPVKAGVGHFFGNLWELTNIVNDGLQWKWDKAANDTGRLLLNSTIGVLGVFDVASRVGLERNDGESFNQTMAYWGIPRGPYLVLPLLGPTTARGVGAIPLNWATSPVTYLEPKTASYGLTALEIVHDRSILLATEELASGDFYLFVRDAYLQRLEYLEKDGQVEDDFGEQTFEDDAYEQY